MNETSSASAMCFISSLVIHDVLFNLFLFFSPGTVVETNNIPSVVFCFQAYHIPALSLRNRSMSCNIIANDQAWTSIPKVQPHEDL